MAAHDPRQDRLPRNAARRGALPADRRSADESRQPLRHDPAGRKFDVGRPSRLLHRPRRHDPRRDLLSAGAGPQLRRDQTRARRPANRRPLQRGAARRLASGRRSDRAHRLVVGRCRRAHDPSRRRDAVLRLVLLHAAAAAGRARRSSRTISAKQPQSWQSRN